jgi:hypothetical protein
MTTAAASLILHKPAIAPMTLADGLRRNVARSQAGHRHAGKLAGEIL